MKISAFKWRHRQMLKCQIYHNFKLQWGFLSMFIKWIEFWIWEFDFEWEFLYTECGIAQKFLFTAPNITKLFRATKFNSKKIYVEPVYKHRILICNGVLSNKTISSIVVVSLDEEEDIRGKKRKFLIHLRRIELIGRAGWQFKFYMTTQISLHIY